MDPVYGPGADFPVLGTRQRMLMKLGLQLSKMPLAQESVKGTDFDLAGHRHARSRFGFGIGKRTDPNSALDAGFVGYE